MKRSLFRVVVGLGAVIAAAGLLVIPAGAAARPFCGQTWGSLPRQTGQGGSPIPLTGVRAGQHACYDRLVFDLSGQSTGYNVRYESPVFTQGEGRPLSLRGAASINITLHAATYDLNGVTTYNPQNRANVVNVSGFRTFRQVAFGGSFEGYTTFGLGVRARLPFRVFVLAGPGGHSRVVVDVGHQW